MGQYKIRKAFRYFKNGFVDKIVTKPMNDHSMLAKTVVMPSQRLNDDKHLVWILFDKSGNIITAHCSCTAGMSQCCNHIVAALYKIEFANENGLTSPLCTEESCKWNTSTKAISPMKIKDMDIE